MGEGIQRIGHDRLELQHDGVGGERDVAHRRALGCEITEGGQQAQRADEDVAVHLHHLPEPHGIEDEGAAEAAAHFRQQPAHDDEAQRQPGIFGDHAGRRDAFHTPAEAQHEQQVEHQIHQIHRDLHDQRHPRLLQRQEPADQRKFGQRRRRRPDTDLEIGGGLRADIGAGIDRPQGKREDRHLQGNGRQPQRAGQQQGAGQGRAHLVGIAGTGRLRRQAGGAHAQEAEAPEQVIEHQRADRDRADIVRRGQVTDHRRIDHADQWHGDVRQYDRPGQRPDAAVHGRKVGGGVLLAHAGCIAGWHRNRVGKGGDPMPKQTTRLAPTSVSLPYRLAISGGQADAPAASVSLPGLDSCPLLSICVPSCSCWAGC